jgi:S-(hydroxymethyl)glutathione dehydrogenase/alcohol dehydrogenase
MKAAIYREPLKDLTFEDVTVDKPKGREVLVNIQATGVCHSDLHVVDGLLPIPAPAILGHEGAGIVEAVGPDVTSVKKGDHVIACLSMFCGRCENCLTGKPQICAGREGLTARPESDTPRISQQGTALSQFTGLGTYAEQMLVHENALVDIRKDIPFEVAALIGCGVTTGVGAALNTAKVEPGSTVAVFGAGGVGISAIQGAYIAGARQIIAVDVFPQKLETAKQFGATDTVDASQGDPVEKIVEMTGGGVDYAFEAIGKRKTAEQAYAAARRGGTAVVIGVLPAGEMISINGLDLLGTEKVFKGSSMGSNRFRVDMPRYIELYLQGRLKLDEMVSKRMKLEDLNEAFRIMKAGEVTRSVLLPNN